MVLSTILFFSIFLFLIAGLNIMNSNRYEAAGLRILKRLESQFILKLLDLNKIYWNRGFSTRNSAFKRCDLYLTKDLIIIIGHNRILGVKLFFPPVILSRKKIRQSTLPKGTLFIQNFEILTRASMIKFELEHDALIKIKVDFGIYKLSREVMDRFEDVVKEHFGLKNR